MPDRAADRISKPGSTRCASACRSRRRWRTGSTATPAAASCSAATRRRCAGSARCSPSGQVEKIYWAVVAGSPAEAEGRIDAAAQEGDARHRLAHGGRPGGPARPSPSTACSARRDGRAWLELRPRTGRTHQIRVHCAALGCPVVGDPAYGGPGGRRRCCCTPGRSPCRSIRRGRRIAVTAPVPPHMLAALAGWAMIRPPKRPPPRWRRYRHDPALQPAADGGDLGAGKLFPHPARHRGLCLRGAGRRSASSPRARPRRCASAAPSRSSASARSSARSITRRSPS